MNAYTLKLLKVTFDYFSLLKDLSPDATVTGIPKKILYTFFIFYTYI